MSVYCECKQWMTIADIIRKWTVTFCDWYCAAAFSSTVGKVQHFTITPECSISYVTHHHPQMQKCHHTCWQWEQRGKVAECGAQHRAWTRSRDTARHNNWHQVVCGCVCVCLYSEQCEPLCKRVNLWACVLVQQGLCVHLYWTLLQLLLTEKCVSHNLFNYSPTIW